MIPNNVRKISYEAFGHCRGLTTVTLDDGLEEIGEEAFNGCTSLQEIVIPNNVRKISFEAFIDCSGLTTVTLGDGLRTLERGHLMVAHCYKRS